MLLAAIVWVFTAVIVYLFAADYWPFPASISAHGAKYDAHFAKVLITTGIIFFLAQFALGWVIFKFRDDGGKASYSHGNNKLEAVWTTATAVLFIGLVLLSQGIWANVHLAPTPADAMRVEVLAKQFTWSFRYAGPDGQFGRTDIKQINDSGGNPFGIDEKDPAGKDDLTASALRVPVNTDILLTLKSRDVIHNFFVRELRMKQDLVPGLEIPFRFRAERTGTYEIPCSELCGLGHHQMRSTLIVQTAEEFEQWKKQQAAEAAGQ
jgi:cytochrome c oxidase subunit 2